MSDALLTRFHGALVTALRARDPNHLSRPFTVAEIYQDLVPYRSHRTVLGVEMNGDYEHALLRMLAGEGEFLEMESEHALREIRDELQSSNPNTGLYREFAAVDVRLNPLMTDGAATVSPPGEIAGSGATSGAHPSPEDSAAEKADHLRMVPMSGATGNEPLDPEIFEPEPEAAFVSPSEHAPDVCRWCREALPEQENVKFCPFCGTDVHLLPCAGCGEALKPGWRFCIACGVRAQGD